jgi:gamma-glutamylcysteine synthetase
MGNQTAVEWLIIYLKGITSLNCDIVIERAKEMEKQQIIDAFDGFPLSTRNSQNGEEYYTETYKQC